MEDKQFRKILEEMFAFEEDEPEEENLVHEIEVLIRETQENIYDAIEAIQTIR